MEATSLGINYSFYLMTITEGPSCVRHCDKDWKFIHLPSRFYNLSKKKTDMETSAVIPAHGGLDTAGHQHNESQVPGS